MKPRHARRFAAPIASAAAVAAAPRSLTSARFNVASSIRLPSLAWVLALLLGVLALWLGGCASYQLQGKVIEGQPAGVVLVSPNDPRLKQDGIHGVAVNVIIDPRSMSPKRLAPTQTEYDGTFRVPVGEVGAGMLEYEMDIAARATGYGPTHDRMALPGSGRRVLVIMSPGRDVPVRQDEDILRETMRIGEQLLESR